MICPLMARNPAAVSAAQSVHAPFTIDEFEFGEA
jgi:hypothetical protein